jgi:protein-disulfide isomerase
VSNDRKQRAEQMRKEREKADKRQRNVITVAIVAVVVLLVGAGGYAVKAASDDNAKSTDLVAPQNATKDYGIVFDQAAAEAAGADGGASASESPAAGDAEPVSVEVYEDFQCPVCQQFEQVAGPLLKQQVAAGDITLTYKPFSFLDESGGSPNDYSKRATNAALCALDEGGVDDYVKVHDYLYANQPQEGTAGPENAELVTALDGLGISGEAIDSCIRTEKFVPWVKKAREVASDSDREISGTPTVFVDGKKLESFDPQTIQKAIQDAA